MMMIYAKIGTLSGKRVGVVRKRKLPVVGERFLVHEHLDARGWHGRYPPASVRCTDIVDTANGPMFVCERW